MMEIDIQITNRCQLNCCHCVYDSNPKGVEPAPSQLKNIISQLPSIGIDEVHFTGGEPTLYKELVKLISFAKSFNLIVRMQTNGWDVSYEDLEKYYRAGLDSLLVSIDGIPSWHDKFRGRKGNFNHAWEAVQNAVKIGINVRINSVLDGSLENLEAIKSLIQMTSKLPILKHTFFILSRLGRARSYYKEIPNKTQWKEIAKGLEETINNLPQPHIPFAIQKPYSSNKCPIGKHNLGVILADGCVFPCVIFIDDHDPIGNAFEQSLKEIFKPDKYLKYKSKCPYNIGCIRSYSWISPKTQKLDVSTIKKRKSIIKNNL